ncbi:uncharacterized protein AB9W97_008146 [Spinachia spinachia]
MHRHAGPHAFSPLLGRSVTIPPAPMATRATDLHRQLPRAAARPSFAPVPAFRKATQKPFRSTKHGRWGALHVSIAWKIYYHKQLKKIQHKPNTFHPEENLARGPLGPVRPHESATKPNIDSRYDRTADRNEKGPTAEHSSHFSKSYLSDLPTPPSASRHSRMAERERGEKTPDLQWREKLGGGRRVETTKDLLHCNQSWAPSTTPEPDDRRGGSSDGKRKRECDGSGTVKMGKQETVEDTFDPSKNLNRDPSPFGATPARPSPLARPVAEANRGDLSAFDPDSSSCKMIRTPGALAPHAGARMHPYQTACWEPLWDVPQRMDLHRGQNVHKGYSLNTREAIRTLLPAPGQKEAVFGPLYFPLASGQQQPLYLGGREFLHSGHENRRLHPAGYLATSYLQPRQPPLDYIPSVGLNASSRALHTHDRAPL